MQKLIIKLEKEVIFDDPDSVIVSRYNWRINERGYVVTSIKGKIISLHRLINQTPEGMVTDHINGDKLDNRRSNLRSCSQSVNRLNSRKPQGFLSSKYKGVRWRKDVSKYHAAIQFNGKRYNIGYFVDEIEAAKAYDTKVKELFGGYIHLNFQ